MGTILIERLYSQKARRAFYGVFVDSAFAKSFWTEDEAGRFARSLAEKHSLAIRQAQVLPFERRASV